MALSAAQMQEAVINNLPEKTGKTLDEWISIAKGFSLSKKNYILKKLKSEYSLGHVQAQIFQSSHAKHTFHFTEKINSQY